MTHVFDMQLGKVQIPVDMPDWEAEHPYVGEEGRKTLDIVGGWRTGQRKTLPEEMPKTLVARKPRKKWPDAFTGVNGIHVVSERAKDIIERFDPDLHQFFPVLLVTKRGVEIEGPWFIMNVIVRQNSIVVEKSRVLVNPRAPDRLCSFFSSSKTEDVIVDPSKLSSDIHFWREARFMGSLMGSDSLVAALKDAGVKFFSAYRATTDLYDMREG